MTEQTEPDFKPLSKLLDGARDAPAPAAEVAMAGALPPARGTSGIPRARVEDTFRTFRVNDNPSLRKALALAKEVAKGEKWCAFFEGGTGCGKTHLAIAAMHEFGLNRSWFWKVPDFLDFIRVTAYGQELGILATLRSYVAGDFLLVLDDLGTEKPTEWAAEQLYRVIDARCDNHLPTIVTTNIPLEDIESRILSRLGAGYLHIAAPDLRKRLTPAP